MDEFENSTNNEEKEAAESVNEETEAQRVEADKVYEPQSNSYNYTYGQPQYNQNVGDNGYSYNQQQFQQPPFTQQYSQNFNKGDNQKKSNKKGLIILCSVLAGVILVAGTLFAGFIGKTNNGTGVQSYESSSADKEEKVDGGGSVVITAKKEAGALTTTEIAKIAKKSSVGVVVYSASSSSFGNYNNESGSNKAGEGTGVIIELDDQDKYTYVVTCAHVISDKNVKVQILLEDGTTYDAKIVGLDEQTDVGLLKVDNKALQKNAATIGSSKNLQVGQSVYAIGNPGGSEFFGSFTSGVVSAIGRSLNSSTGYTMECIQHDAAINPGNSGGGLLNAQGQLIGINSSKIASTEYEGMSFAVPIDEVVSVVNDLSKYNYVPNRPKLGITYSLARSYSQAYNMIVSFNNLPSGSLIIASISSDSSLAKLDVEKGDIIVSANGKKLDTADVLLDLIENGKVGDKITLGLVRVDNNYKLQNITVKATLVEDKGNSSKKDEEETTQQYDYQDPFSYFFGNGN